MDVGKKLRTNPELANKGRWVPFMDDVELLITSASSPAYRAKRRHLFQTYRAKLRSGGDAAGEATEEIALILLAHEVLKGWKNITEDGVPLVYSPEVSLKLLKDYPPIASFVDTMGDDVAIFQLDEDDRGDSPGRSSGDIPGAPKKDGSASDKPLGTVS
jgi:hypothetical protein